MASGALVVGDDPLSVHSAYKTRTQGSYTSNGSQMTVFCDFFARGETTGKDERFSDIGKFGVYMESKMMALERGPSFPPGQLLDPSTFQT